MAKSFNEGHIEQGVDGKSWEVKLRTNGVKYWKKIKVVD